MLSVKNVAVIVYDQVDALDVTGPFDTFAIASNWGQDFRVYTVALESKNPVRTISGLTIQPDFASWDCPAPDVLVVPGGWGSRKEMYNEKLTGWIYETSQRASFTLSVCTGALLLAKAGLLEELRATTNRRAMDLLKEAAPASTMLVENVRYVDNGRLITSAGVTAGIDAALHLVAKLLGEERALETASRLEHDWRREPSEWLAFHRAKDGDVDGIRSLFVDAAEWIHSTHGLWQWRAEHFNREMVEAFVRDQEVFVATLGNEYVGCFSMHWRDKEIWGEKFHEDAGYVHRLCVSRKRKGEGIGRELIHYAESYIQSRGKRWLRLDCMSDNPSLNAYYVNSGFSFQGLYDAGMWSANLYEREIKEKTPAR
ncbi:GNAT family N-acetyltransferase [Paenibacillus sp. OV219]|uniref:GNAT family N-acetyltransferase n=1 Tax=Paenibacillus sp. OV219 TaxID=1884377 RepID=UPI0008CB0A03|nr:GNAT family N-acetyltransferase [Paenibacillus sp. OV219]SEO97229.1 Acetyltransferase (GNAT) family protein [Paenibacillus sp. OV219]